MGEECAAAGTSSLGGDALGPDANCGLSRSTGRGNDVAVRASGGGDGEPDGWREDEVDGAPGARDTGAPAYSSVALLSASLSPSCGRSAGSGDAAEETPTCGCSWKGGVPAPAGGRGAYPGGVAARCRVSGCDEPAPSGGGGPTAAPSSGTGPGATPPAHIGGMKPPYPP